VETQAVPQQSMPYNGQPMPQGMPATTQTAQQAMVAAGQMPTRMADNQPIVAGVIGGVPSGSPTASAAPGDDVFVPQVRGPNDRPATASHAGGTGMVPGSDRADMRQGGRDAAFVF
jgi:type IV secretion system protein VirB1